MDTTRLNSLKTWWKDVNLMRQIKDSREHGKRTETENMMKEYIICLQEHKE